MIDILAILKILFYSLTYDSLKWIYRKFQPFPLDLETHAEMHPRHGNELILTQKLVNNDVRKTEIKKVIHEVGYPKLERITKEHGTHTDAKFPLILKGRDDEKISITYNMVEGLPKQCKLMTIVEHRYGKNKYIEDINIVFMQ